MSYDLTPMTKGNMDKSIISGYDAIIEEIAKRTDLIKDEPIIIDIYPGVEKNAIINAFSALSRPILDMDDLKRDDDAIKELFNDYITDDRVFGFMCHKPLSLCYDEEKIEGARKKITNDVIIGFGASLFFSGSLHIYYDISRWEIQLRERKGGSNWLFKNNNSANLQKFKIGYFIEWRMADKHKISVFEDIDFFIDEHDPERPKMIEGSIMRESLKEIVKRPFRLEPYFDPGVWGGVWMKEHLGLDKKEKNYAWSFDGVPEENAINVEFKNGFIKIPAMNLVLYQSEKLLGARVYGRYGSEYPIRFDFLDTIKGGNLSLQVHPLTSYIQKTFGMNYTQDESYYLLDAEDDAVVYLGIKDSESRDEMIKDLKAAEKGEIIFDAEKYVNAFKAKKHDHFLIPAGTVHCSGKGAMVLEISSTPYIFTFKLWDWERLGLDGLPRPVHIDHGKENIQWNRNTEWVKNNLVNQFKIIEQNDDYTIEITGLDIREPIITRRYTINTSCTVKMDGSVNQLNLVDGEEVAIESPNNSFDPFIVHYAETFIIPAEVKEYTIKAVKGNVKLIEARIR